MNSHDQIDTDIIDQFMDGDKAAYATIFRHYYPGLYNYGTRFADASLVEDAIQDMFTKFWLGRKDHGTINCLKAYLFVSFRNQLHALARQKRRFIESDIQEPFFKLEVSIDQVMIDAEKLYEERTNLARAMVHLTQRQKEAVFLKFYENLSYEEIAVILDISVKATYKLVARAIGELRQQIKTSRTRVLFSFL